jgi:hypothetical protein
LDPFAIENRALILDLVEWVAMRPRPYAEVMEAWRTSCPRLPIWEDANDHGLVLCETRGTGTIVRVTPAGEALLRAEGRMAPAPAAPAPAVTATSV